MSANELLPCPFCGGEAEIERKGTHRQSMQFACTNCGARVESGDVYGLTDPIRYKWNTRSAPAAVPGPLEGEYDAVRVLAKWHNWICTGQTNFTEEHILESAKILRAHGKKVFHSFMRTAANAQGMDKK